LRNVGDVHDDRMIGRAALGGVEAPEGVGIGGVAAKAVHGLGGERDEAALTEGGYRLFNL
jgi:hypothetical protein